MGAARGYINFSSQDAAARCVCLKLSELGEDNKRGLGRELWPVERARLKEWDGRGLC